MFLKFDMEPNMQSFWKESYLRDLSQKHDSISNFSFCPASCVKSNSAPNQKSNHLSWGFGFSDEIDGEKTSKKMSLKISFHTCFVNTCFKHHPWLGANSLKPIICRTCFSLVGINYMKQNSNADGIFPLLVGCHVKVQEFSNLKSIYSMARAVPASIGNRQDIFWTENGTNISKWSEWYHVVSTCIN